MSEKYFSIIYDKIDKEIDVLQGFKTETERDQIYHEMIETQKKASEEERIRYGVYKGNLNSNGHIIMEVPPDFCVCCLHHGAGHHSH